MPMAADVTSLVRMMETYKEEADGNRRGLFTRDLLGEGDDDPTRSSKELDLDLQVPSGWERCLDLLVSPSPSSSRFNPSQINPNPNSKMQSERDLHRVDPNPTRRGLQDSISPSLPRGFGASISSSPAEGEAAESTRACARWRR
ncbi:hypothetical protein HPP92_026634 [Vanilla planifolia]|uniref:Uncharacterized protein n=1 Tax=Vanilla planifolia TaxID=51239 RepID=A0A835U7M7_VANPL|nr:hypothetical protein HPP92_026634 [Vanilla planifolia]